VHDGRNRVSTLDNGASGSANLASYAYSYDWAGIASDFTGVSFPRSQIPKLGDEEPCCNLVTILEF
jgi:hypothetical protein